MIVRPDSPLRRLPHALDRKQILFLNSIRVAAEIVDMTYARLEEVLLRLAKTDATTGGQGIPIIPAFQDSWSMIDSVNRLCCLLRRMRRMKQKAPGLQLFYHAPTNVEALHNIVQHLDSESDSLFSPPRPFPCVSWRACAHEGAENTPYQEYPS